MLAKSNLNSIDPPGTRRPRDVSWSSSKGPNVWDLQVTFRGLLGNNTKIDDLMKKVFFRCNSPCFTHLLLFFSGKRNISKWGRPPDVRGTQLRDVLETKWWDVLETSAGRRSYMFFRFNSEKYSTYFYRWLKNL